MATKKKRASKARGKSVAEKQDDLQLVSLAWIGSALNVHASTVEIAWRRGELRAAALYLAGNGRERPLFCRADAVAWFERRASA